MLYFIYILLRFILEMTLSSGAKVSLVSPSPIENKSDAESSTISPHVSFDP